MLLTFDFAYDGTIIHFKVISGLGDQVRVITPGIFCGGIPGDEADIFIDPSKFATVVSAPISNALSSLSKTFSSNEKNLVDSYFKLLTRKFAESQKPK